MESFASAVEALAELGARVRAGAGSITVTGCDGPLLAAAVARAAVELPPSARPLVVLVPDEARARMLARDVEFFLPREEQTDDPARPPRVLHLPAVETSPFAEISPDRRAVMRRLATFFRLSQGGGGAVLVASTSAMLRRVIPRVELGKLCDVVVPDSDLDREALAGLLTRAGFGRTAVVEDPGTFAVRGGVIDVFSPLYRYPARIELFGDVVESIRFFDPVTQRTMRPLSELYLFPVRETVRTAGNQLRAKILDAADAVDHPTSKTRVLLEQLEAGEDFFGIEALMPAFHARMAPLSEYLPAEATWVVVDPTLVRKLAAEEIIDARERWERRRGEHKIGFAPGEHYLEADELDGLRQGHVTISVEPIEMHGEEAGVRFAAESNRTIAHELQRARAEKADELLRPLVAHLREAADEGYRLAVVCPNLAHADRLRGLLKGYGVASELAPEGRNPLTEPPGATLTIYLGPLTEGWRSPADRLLVLADEEIFGARARRQNEARAGKTSKTPRTLSGGLTDFAQLQPGDYVVHTVNGVGQYLGLTKLPLKGTPIDFLHIGYEGGQLYLPVYRLSEIQRYVGAEGGKPRLDKMGGVTWEKTKRKVSAEVKQLAEELLKLYAQRQALPGHAFPPADEMFHEFEATFPFEETPDQQKAIDDVTGDMEKAQPMDRLVCGDVGYGKTEVALRAALKAVLGGKQVAMLAPTTVLVEQHHQTLKERFQGWPVKVAVLSRFSPRADQLEVVKKLGDKQIDVVVGTHRLLSNDVRFKDLGLLIVDEEQRFGVTHKERLKKLRTQVDVLTLTATPIPRTMHMAMMGLREVSIIATPPVDRLAIRTFVCRPDDSVIREALRKELARGGQAFFVSHRIGDDHGKERSLAEWAQHLRELVPEAKVAVAHGQMDPESLEKIMIGFVDGEYDVLCCTTIVESGLDIPRANTMFVNRADAFGLAQLYQLRGRIGRGKERAFCYLMVPPLETLSTDAKQRLQVLQRFTELGAGFQIASHDLEIRGAGDLLGAQQSGQIAAVGFETYMQILGEAVAELRGQPIQHELDPELNVDVPGYIPDDMVPDTGQRLDLYKRLSDAPGEDEVKEVLAEMRDRYGELPDEVHRLGELMILKGLGRRLGAQSIDLQEARLTLALDSSVTPLKPEKVLGLVNRKGGSPYRLTPDMRLLRTFSEGEKQNRLAAAKRCMEELLALT